MNAQPLNSVETFGELKEALEVMWLALRSELAIEPPWPPTVGGFKLNGGRATVQIQFGELEATFDMPLSAIPGLLH